MARLFLAGYFGCGNLGDDAILLGFLNGLRDKGHQVKALCGNVDALMRQYGVPGVHKRDFGTIRSAIAESDALVFPGGSIFQDATSARSVAYYAKLVSTAKKSHVKVALLAQGVGPLKGACAKSWAAKAFDAADLVVVRDPASVTTLKSIGCKSSPKVGADMAWLLPESSNPAKNEAFGVAGTSSVGISARPWGKGKHVVEIFAELARMLTQNGYIPTFVELDEAEDGPLILEIAKKVGGKVPDMRGLGSPITLQQRIARFEGMISMRLHGGILAAAAGVPTYLVSYDPKVSALANIIGAPAPPNIQGATAQRIYEGFVEFIKDRDRVSEALVRKKGELVKQARLNIDALSDLLGA